MEEKDETCDPDCAGRWIQSHVPGAAYDYQQQLYQMCLGGPAVSPVVAFDVNCAAEYTAMADGLLLTGGMSDIHARNYGQIYKDRMGGPATPAQRTAG